MGGLTSRVTRIANRLGIMRSRFVIVSGDPTGGPGGGIRPFPNGSGFLLTVPPGFESDPVSGLDERQRTQLGPSARLIAVVRVEDPDGELDRTQAAGRAGGLER